MPILRDDEIAKEVETWWLEINTLNRRHRDNVSALSAARVAWHDQHNSSKITRNRNYIPSPGEQDGPGGGQDDNLLDALANVPEGVQRQGQRRSHGTWRSPIRTAENGQQDQAAAPGNTVPSGNNNNTGTPAVPPGGSGGSVGQNGQGHVGPGSTF
ncbi:hypothetical protein ACKAV7_011362 [Fusarium commune]